MSHFMQIITRANEKKKEEPKWEANGAKPRKNGILLTGRRIDAMLHVGRSGG